MKKEFEKKLLKVMKKVVETEVDRNKYGGGPPYCPAIFHQPMRPQKKQKYME